MPTSLQRPGSITTSQIKLLHSAGRSCSSQTELKTPLRWGEGDCVYINNAWCSNIIKVDGQCLSDVEFLTLRLITLLFTFSGPCSKPLLWRWLLGIVVRRSFFEKGDQWVLSLCEKAYSRMLERRLWPIVKPQIQVEQHRFHPGHGTVNQFFTLLLEVSSSLHMFGLGEGLWLCPQGALSGLRWEYGVPLLWYIIRVRAVSVFLAGSQTCFQWVLGSARVVMIRFVIFMD